MWFNRPAYSSYIPSGYSHQGFDEPHARAIARERAAREREAAARHAELLHWQRMQDAARPPHSSYPSDGGGSFVPYPYTYNPHTSAYPIYEDSKRPQALERRRQLELARRAELNRRRGEERNRELEECSDVARKRGRAFTSSPYFSIPISSPGGSPPTTPHTTPTHLPKSPPPPPEPEPTTLEATQERIRAAMTIQEFYRNRVARQQALTSIAEVSTQFEQLKSAFSPPPQLDYRGASPDDVVVIPVPPQSFAHASTIPPPSEDAEIATETSKSLAFTPNNKVVLEYIENLNRLIDKLDGIESGGHASVREQRKQAIRNVEAEAQWMDRWIAVVWKMAHPPGQGRLKPQSTR